MWFGFAACNPIEALVAAQLGPLIFIHPLFLVRLRSIHLVGYQRARLPEYSVI